MRAIVRDSYGLDVLRVTETDRPEVDVDGILVKVRAASINRADWYEVTGTPYVGRPMMGIRKPKSHRVGGDYAGIVEAVGDNVTDFRVGDEVFGLSGGALAEYVRAGVDIAHKPKHLTFEEAASVPMAGLTSLQGLRDKGHVRSGHKVLINGASGGVGTFAVQIAKALGAEVTAVCSTSNVSAAQSIGADHVIDYTREDFTRSAVRYHVLFDIAGNRPWRDCKRVLDERARVVLVGGPMGGLLGPLGHVAMMRVGALTSSRAAIFFIAKANREDMEVLRELLEARQVTPVIDRHYDFDRVGEAFRYLGEGHAHAKIVVSL